MIVCNFFFILSSFRNTEPPSVIIGMCTWKVHPTSLFGSIIRLQVRVHFRHCKKLIWKKFVLVANTLTVPTTIFKKIQVMIFYSVSARTWAEDWFVQPSSFSDQEMAWFSLGLVRDRSPVRDVANLWIPESRRRTDRFRRIHKISSNYLFFCLCPLSFSFWRLWDDEMHFLTTGRVRDNDCQRENEKGGWGRWTGCSTFGILGGEFCCLDGSGFGTGPRQKKLFLFCGGMLKVPETGLEFGCRRQFGVSFSSIFFRIFRWSRIKVKKRIFTWIFDGLDTWNLN